MTESSGGRGKFYLSAALTAVLSLLSLAEFVYFLIFSLMAADTCWLVRTGDFILARRALPEHDLFSWTLSDKQYVCYQWLFEVLLSLIDRCGGLWFLGLSASLVAGLICFFILPRFWLKSGLPLNLILLFLPLSMAPTLFYVRPQLASYLIAPAFIAVLEGWRRRQLPDKRIFFLPLLSLLWANLHSFCVTAPVIVACYAVDAWFSKQSRQRMAIASWTALFCLLSILVNPYGFGLFSYIYSFAGEQSFNIIGELAPLWDTREIFFLPFDIYLLILWLILIKNRRSLPLAGLLVSFVATAAALFLVRFASLCVLVSWPFLGIALSAMLKKEERVLPLAARASRLHLVSVLCIAFLAWYLRVPTQKQAAITFTNNDLQLFQFLQANHNPKQRIFNDSQTGAYLIYFGLTPVFIDNRYDFYGRQFCEEWFSCWSAYCGWQDYLRKNKIERIVIRNDCGLYSALLESPDWLLFYSDVQASVWLSDSEENRQLIAGTVRDRLDPVSRAMTLNAMRAKSLSTGKALMNRAEIRRALDEFQRALDYLPDDAELHHQLIHVLAVAGLGKELQSELERARRFFPDSGGTSWAKDAAAGLLEKYRDSPLRKKFELAPHL